MPLPIRHLPLVQNWDCHVSGSCCQEYQVTITEDEKKRIESQGWKGDSLLGDRPPVIQRGPWWSRRHLLNHREDGSCVFLSPEGRCRIHERFGYETKPLPCRLFPFVLVPVGDHWRVGIRFACPSAAENKGRSIAGHLDALKSFALELAEREGLGSQPGKEVVRPPHLAGGAKLDWSDLLRIIDGLSAIMRNGQDTIELRWRKCLAFSDRCKEAKLDHLQGKRLSEFLELMRGNLNEEVAKEPSQLSPPNWVGRVLFRQALALFTRKDHGPNRGIARQGRVALLKAAIHFATGRGVVPRLHAHIPHTTFEQVENTPPSWSEEAEQILDRYYTIKLDAVQFCGAPNFHIPFWEGLDMLATTYPIIRWVARTFLDLSPQAAVTRALSIVDDHFGYNRVLRSRRQRTSFRILSSTGQLKNLIAWYGK